MTVPPASLREALSEWVYDPRNSGTSVELLLDGLTEAAWAAVLTERWAVFAPLELSAIHNGLVREGRSAAMIEEIREVWKRLDAGGPL